MNARAGLDIGLEGWRPDRWPALHEDVHVLGVVLDADVSRLGRLAVGVGKVVGGRNTPAYGVYTVTWTRGFGTPWR